jgi:hypothetical protein
LSADKPRGIIPEIGAKINKKGLEKVVEKGMGLVYNVMAFEARFVEEQCGGFVDIKLWKGE